MGDREGEREREGDDRKRRDTHRGRAGEKWRPKRVRESAVDKEGTEARERERERERTELRSCVKVEVDVLGSRP